MPPPDKMSAKLRAAIVALSHEIDLVFDHNPPPLSADPRSSSICTKLAPLSFYDRHLDEHLRLKNITLLPSLAFNISEAVDKSMCLIREEKNRLPFEGFPNEKLRKQISSQSMQQMLDANSVAKNYQFTVAMYCVMVAPVLCLHRHAPRWSSVLRWNRLSTQKLPIHPAMQEDFSLEVCHIADKLNIPEDMQDSLTDEIREDLHQVLNRFPILATWQFFAISSMAEDALKTMDKVAPDAFRYEENSVKWRPSSCSVLPCRPDATNTSWDTLVSSFTEINATEISVPLIESSTSDVLSLQKSIQIDKNQDDPEGKIGKRTSRKRKYIAKQPTVSKVKISEDEQWPTISNVGIKGPKPRSDDMMAASIIQHAWAQSAHNDSTFIILNCGNFERIGFRHRASQTLFLSELIEVPKCQNPAYGKLHIGLYISIIEDVIDRTRQLCALEGSNTRKRRRKMPTPSEGAYKRPKTRASVTKEKNEQLKIVHNNKILPREASSRNLVLVELRYGCFNSPKPALFLRVGHSPENVGDLYKPNEYFSLVLASEIASGATGIVHNATLELLASDGETRKIGVVVKLSFQPEQQKRMRHEFSIYEHLISMGVGGIPTVFGLFENVEGDTLALVMSHVGVCLWDRIPDETVYQVSVSSSERVAFVRVINEIHQAGVRHRDIRPENLMVDDSGSVTIIDFDRAIMNPTKGSKKRELDHLLSLLDGKYRAPDSFPSVNTPSNEGDSEDDSD